MKEDKCPRQTPWGQAQQIKGIALGIWEVSTASHGGIYLAPWRQQAAPEWLLAPTGYSGNGWFEEDCDWALACAAFPVEFGPRACHYALRHATTSKGEYLRDRWARYLTTPLAELLKQEAASYEPEPEVATA